MTGTLVRRGEGLDRGTHTGRRLCKDGGEGWSDAATGQGSQRLPEPPEVKKRQGRILP